MSVNRYHPALVILHWLLALLLLLSLAGGFFVLESMPNSDPAKLDMLQGHMAFGISIGVLMLVRLVIRLTTKSPPSLNPANPVLEKIAALVHWGFYVLVLLMAGSGMATALAAHLNDIVFARNGEKLPEDFGQFPTMELHEGIASLLVLFLALHVAGVIYHHFIRKEGVLGRMGFGKRQ